MIVFCSQQVLFLNVQCLKLLGLSDSNQIPDKTERVAKLLPCVE